MGYATNADVTRLTGLSFDAGEQTDVDILCDDASAFMEMQTGSDDLTTVAKAGALRLLCVNLVAGLWTMRLKVSEFGGVNSVKIGDFAVSFEKVAEADPKISAALERLTLAAETDQGVEVAELDLSGV